MSKESGFIKLLSVYLSNKKGGTIIHEDISNSSIDRQIAEGPGATQVYRNMKGVAISNGYSGPDATRHNLNLLMRDIALSGNPKSQELLSILSNIIGSSNTEEQKSSYRKLLEFVALHNDALGPFAVTAVSLASSVIKKISQ
ncbi:hypothetical protein ACKS9G_001988 [Cronobacter turicensis]